MTVFPPAAAVTVVLDGRPLQAYNRAYASAGRVFAPLDPFVTSIADRLWFEGNTLVIVRDGRAVYVRMRARAPDALDYTYVPLAAVVRGLGASVRYQRGAVEIRLPGRSGVETPAPFDANAPQIAPRAVFTPMVLPTPRPVWNGPALPRRTPLPFSSPKP